MRTYDVCYDETGRQKHHIGEFMANGVIARDDELKITVIVCTHRNQYKNKEHADMLLDLSKP